MNGGTRSVFPLNEFNRFVMLFYIKKILVRDCILFKCNSSYYELLTNDLKYHKSALIVQCPQVIS